MNLSATKIGTPGVVTLPSCTLCVYVFILWPTCPIQNKPEVPGERQRGGQLCFFEQKLTFPSILWVFLIVWAKHSQTEHQPLVASQN